MPAKKKQTKRKPQFKETRSVGPKAWESESTMDLVITERKYMAEKYGAPYLDAAREHIDLLLTALSVAMKEATDWDDLRGVAVNIGAAIEVCKRYEHDSVADRNHRYETRMEPFERHLMEMRLTAYGDLSRSKVEAA